jgi:hypothetical protein
MFRIPARAALAVLALVASVSPATAEEPVTVGYSSEAGAYISMVYRPPVGVEIHTSPHDGVTKADCLADYTGTGDVDPDNTIIYATFVAKVATTAEHDADRPQDSIAVATGIRCSLRDERDNSLIKEWVAVRPGNAAYDVFGPERVEHIKRPKICVEAWVLYGDGTELTIDRRCDRV